LDHTTVILTSDHGNIEDLSVRNHTLNDVPTFVWGAARNKLSKPIVNLADITPAIMEILTSESK
jgi:bisphosphoglycerate-independent phosphoglycerate mutase (AlkP superfamily)